MIRYRIHFACVILLSSAAALWPITQSFDSTIYSYGSGASLSFSNSGAATVTAGSSLSLNYKSVYGPAAAAITISAASSIGFSDASPGSTETNPTTNVMAYITVIATGTTGIHSVKYRVSSSGPSGFPATWLTDVTTDTITSATHQRFRVQLSSFSAQPLSESSNNYIQWYAQNDAAVDDTSSAFRIIVQSAGVPVVAIIQPDKKGGIAAVLPYVSARVTASGWSIDPAGITVRVERSDGTLVHSVASSANPSLFTPATGMVAWQYDGPVLQSGGVYVLKVFARDENGHTGSGSVTFTAQGGAIADLIPYPSPFDPAVQPITIRYIIAKSATVTVNLYDLAGRLVRSVIRSESRPAGINEEQWNGVNYAGDHLANGIYLCEIVVKDEDGEHRRHTALAILGR